MIVQFRNMSTFGVSNYITLSDKKGSVYSPRYHFFPVEASGSLVIDFSDSPRRFEGEKFGINITASLGATEFIVFEMYGWEEQQ